MLRPLVVIANRNALHLREKGPLLETLRGARSRTVDLHETHSLDELRDVVARIPSLRPRGVVLAGGDGTLTAGLTALARVYGTRPLPDIAVAPGGTVCTVGRNFGVRGTRASYTHHLLQRLAHGTALRHVTRVLSVLEPGEGEAPREPRLGFIFGFGLVSSFFDRYYASGPRERLGLGAAARIVGRVFAESFFGGPLARQVLSPQAAEVTTDGETAPYSGYSLFVASVLPDLGLHMHLTYQAQTRHDRFHVVASALGPTALGPQLPRVLAGRALAGDGLNTLAERVVVRFRAPSTASGGRAYILDGELFDAERVEVSMGPEITLRGV
ncbi:MAG TPA: diacylglycerol kinase family protein [Polyangiaceae bacterium]|nr:diacylglycerol kinase family protein [Polyangiaceae bacterium]